jgi:hypothetical protein
MAKKAQPSSGLRIEAPDPLRNHLTDRKLIGLSDPALAVHLPPKGAVVPAEETGEPYRSVSGAEVPEDGGSHQVNI